jgi:hypothetical protein
MNKPLALLLLLVGALLTIWGFKASDSMGSGFSRIFSGAPTDRTIWLLFGGLVVGVLGLGSMLRGSKL